MPVPQPGAKPRRILSTLALIAVASVLGGCTSLGTPPASALKLARMSPLEADPGAMRFALATPDFLRLADGDITVTVTYLTGDPATGFVEQYAPVVEAGAPAAPGIDRSRLGDARIVVARFSEEDSQAFRAMQARVKADKANGGEGKGSITVGATGCRVGPVPDGPIPISSWMQTGPDEPFFALMRGVDLRRQLRKAGVDAAAMPACDD